jgi:hypothetical protein
MATDLEGAIRDALHADGIGAGQLLYPALRVPVRRRPARLLAAAGAAAAVAVVAIVATLLVSGHRGPGQAGTDPLAGVIGYRWRVIQLADQRGAVSLPKSLDAQIGFTRDGYVLGNDTVNAMQGKYQVTAGGYTVRDGGGTLAGYVGDDPLRTRLINAVDAMFVTVVATGEQTPPPLIVQASLTSGTLTLRRDGTTLTLEQHGRQPDFFAQSPSATPTGATGRIEGTLQISPPLGQHQHPTPGTIVISGPAHLTSRVARDGRFDITVPTGRYTIIGHSPRFIVNGRQGDCLTQNPAVVTADATTHVTVTCTEK